jgi:hypothetical protein
VARLNTTNAIALDIRLLGVSQGSRRKLDGTTVGFAATPSANRQETVLSPAGAGNNPPANVIAITVKSFVWIRTSGKVTIKVTRADNTFYTQVIYKVFMLSPDAEVDIEIVTAETHNVNATVVWS